MKKVAIYIDGSNFYFSLKSKFNCKINIEEFCKKLTKEENLIQINYYLSPVGENNLHLYTKQQKFFEKLLKVEKLRLVFGRLEKRKREGKTYYIEKATDVNLALDLVLDGQANIYEKAYLVSNDGDFSEAVKETIKRFQKEIVYVCISNKKGISHHLKKVSSKVLKIDELFISNLKIKSFSSFFFSSIFPLI